MKSKKLSWPTTRSIRPDRLSASSAFQSSAAKPLGRQKERVRPSGPALADPRIFRPGRKLELQVAGQRTAVGQTCIGANPRPRGRLRRAAGPPPARLRHHAPASAESISRKFRTPSTAATIFPPAPAKVYSERRMVSPSSASRTNSEPCGAEPSAKLVTTWLVVGLSS